MMRPVKPKVFGSYDYPLRASMVSGLFQCPRKIQLMWEQFERDEAGPAAQTGSLLHLGVEEWHRTKLDVRRAFKALDDAMDKFPLASHDEAVGMLKGYCQDQRNITASIVHLETRFTHYIDPHPMDLTQEKIFLTGQVDQVRRDLNDLIVYDVKSSTRNPDTINIEYSLQQWIYIYLMRKQGIDVRGYRIIRTRQYLRKEYKPETVFLDGLPYIEKGVERFLDMLRYHVMMIRNKTPIPISQGEHCLWCPFSSPVNCLLRD